MNYPISYIDYLIQFHATRDYFECHELLEEYWKENPQDGFGELWVACIQIAVAQYHERRSNRRGAELMYEAALYKLALHSALQIGLEHNTLVKLLEERLVACKNSTPYEDLILPIYDKQLLDVCQQEAKKRGYVWLQSSQGLPDEVIHRHTMRDRSDVIAQRRAALEARQQLSKNKKTH